MLRQRSVGKNERYARKEKERNEKERGMTDERARTKQKPESKKGGEVVAEEKEGGTVKGPVDDKAEKKGSRIKGDKKGLVSAREGRLTLMEGSVPEEGTGKDLKKEKIPLETMKEKVKGEKSLGKSDPKQHHLESTGSTEERSEGEGSSDFTRKKDKQSKDSLKRSKSHTEFKSQEKIKVRQDGKDVGGGSKDKSSSSEASKHSSDTKVRNTDSGPKVKSVSEKTRSKSRDDSKPQSPSLTKADKKSLGQEAKSKVGAAPSKPDFSKEKKKEGVMKEDRRVSEDRAEKVKDAKSTRKTSEKKAKESEKKGGDGEKERRISEADDLSSSSSVPSAATEEVKTEVGMASQSSNTQVQESLESFTTSDLTTKQVFGESDLKTPQAFESLTESFVSPSQTMDSAAESDSTNQSISKTFGKSEFISDSQAMDTESNIAPIQSADLESNLTAPQTMDTEYEPTPSQAIDTESSLTSPQPNATKSDLISSTESFEKEHSQPAESELASTPPPPQSSELISVSDHPVPQSSDSHQRSDLMKPNSDVSGTVKLNSEIKQDADLAHSQSSNSIPAPILTVPEISNSIPESDLTFAQASNSVTASEFTITRGSDMLPDPVPADSNSTVPDDMYDALSDITPDPDDEEEATMRLAESQPQPHLIPAGADALLTLMDVCASAAVHNSAGGSDKQEAESSFRDEDIKMQEAALTLLSMDPDQAISPNFIAEDVTGQQVEPVASDLVNVTTATDQPKEDLNKSEGKSSACEELKHTEGSALLFTHLYST